MSKSGQLYHGELEDCYSLINEFIEEATFARDVLENIIEGRGCTRTECRDASAALLKVLEKANAPVD